jgi:N-acetylneuraminate synthase
MIKIVAEIGINHNGSLDIAKKLIDSACSAGCDYVKFQKRNPDVSTPDNQKNKIKDSLWGSIKYIDYKHKLEFSKKEYDIINDYCFLKNIKWFCSVWDNDSVDFIKEYNSFGVFIKIPSAVILNLSLLKYARKHADVLAISTGMSDESEVAQAIKISNPDIIFHTNSSYPSIINEINLNYISWLKNNYKEKEIGYSGHEKGYLPTLCSVPLGVSWIERHITLDKNMKGSDHSCSLDPIDFKRLVKKIKKIESYLGKNEPRKISPGELLKRETMR